MSLHIFADGDRLSEGLAEWIVGNMLLTLQAKERYSFVLSGGSTPKALYHVLSEKYASAVDWNKVDFFWGDERYVPFDDERNNARMAYSCLLAPLKIPEQNIHPIPTNRGPRECADDYEKLLKNYFEGEEARFDLVLLGMGDDGHTLSLFPGSDLISTRDAQWVKDAFNVKEQLPRITLMPSIVNLAHSCVFLLQGAAKAETLYSVLKGSYQPDVYPTQLIRPQDGRLYWFLDEAAAANL